MMSDIEKVLKERISAFEKMLGRKFPKNAEMFLLHQLLTHHLQESTEVFVQMKD